MGIFIGKHNCFIELICSTITRRSYFRSCADVQQENVFIHKVRVLTITYSIIYGYEELCSVRTTIRAQGKMYSIMVSIEHTY